MDAQNPDRAGIIPVWATHPPRLTLAVNLAKMALGCFAIIQRWAIISERLVPTSNSGGIDDEGLSGERPPVSSIEIANEARRLQADIDAYQKLKDAAQKTGDVGLTDYYDTQIQIIQNEINRLFGIRPNPWRGG